MFYLNFFFASLLRTPKIKLTIKNEPKQMKKIDKKNYNSHNNIILCMIKKKELFKN